MPTYDLKPCFTGASGHNISRGGCPGYAGGGSALGPIPNGSGEITVPGGQCYSGTYVYKNNLVVGDCDDCETLEIEFIETPELQAGPHYVYVCRAGPNESNWHMENTTGLTGISFLNFSGQVRLDPDSGANPLVVRACDGGTLTTPVEYNFNQGTWGTSSTFEVGPISFFGCNQHISNLRVDVRATTQSNPCSGSNTYCQDLNESIRVIYSDQLGVNTSCPGVTPSICESETSVDFTSAAYYTPASSCDSVISPGQTTTITLHLQELGNPGNSVSITQTGSNSNFKNVNVRQLLFPGGIGGVCEVVEYYFEVSTEIEADASTPAYTFSTPCELTGTTCTMEICPAPDPITGASFDTCTDL